MPTLILPNRHSADYTSLWQVAIAKGWKTERWPLRAPFPSIEGEVVLYCDPLTASLVKKHTNITLDETSMDWLTQVPREYVKRKILAGTFAELPNLAKQIQGPWFIKPADDKVFPAAIYTTLEDTNLRDVEPQTPIILSEPIEFKHEWRFFLKDRKISAYSIYAREGKPFKHKWTWEEEEETQAIQFMESILRDNRINCLPSQVIDIGATPNGWSIVETNDAYASGIYGCDPIGVLEALSLSIRTIA